MARITVLPSESIIRGLKGILDFYVWRGLPCVRAWPKYRPARQTAASLAAALTFGAIVKAYALLANQALLAYREDALDQPRTARDIMVTGTYGNLHEASMSDFLDALIIIRDGVVALTDLLHALDSIDTDEIVVNVDQSVLPPLAATTTNQATQITALQKLDDLQDALESKALDRLLVRGMDQLFSLDAVVADERHGTISGAGGFYDSDPVPAGKYWLIRHIWTQDDDNPTTAHVYYIHHNGVDTLIHWDSTGFAANISGEWPCNIVLDAADTIRVSYLGALAGDTVRINVAGAQMTKET